jgi:hypothetical protein
MSPGSRGELRRLSHGAMTIFEYVVVALLFALTRSAVLWAMKARE